MQRQKKKHTNHGSNCRYFPNFMIRLAKKIIYWPHRSIYHHFCQHSLVVGKSGSVRGRTFKKPEKFINQFWECDSFYYGCFILSIPGLNTPLPQTVKNAPSPLSVTVTYACADKPAHPSDDTPIGEHARVQRSYLIYKHSRLICAFNYSGKCLIHIICCSHCFQTRR